MCRAEHVKYASWLPYPALLLSIAHPSRVHPLPRSCSSSPLKTCACVHTHTYTHTIWPFRLTVATLKAVEAIALCVCVLWVRSVILWWACARDMIILRLCSLALGLLWCINLYCHLSLAQTRTMPLTCIAFVPSV